MKKEKDKFTLFTQFLFYLLNTENFSSDCDDAH